MKCIIVDDEPMAREGMLMNAQETPFLEVLGTFENAVDANRFLASHEVDLMFLDIEMPGINGLDFLRNLQKKPLVILTTAYPQYALESYELDTVDYLLKPVRLDRFIKAVSKAREWHELLQMANQHASVEIEQDFIYLKSDRKYVKLFLKDIVYVKGMKDYSLFITPGEKVMTAMNIKSIQEKLPPNLFARISKSCLVNIHYIKAIHHDLIQLLDSTDELTLSDGYREDFINRFVKTNLVQR